ncbi:PTH1 family peptidyl-tRNA hydrolase [Inhella inkyongensis]|uniref:Peptidyl-tRNA hydrolase n=1 Tax=Inhella inkyongensis TaxID=392593 RepID=A0A840S760_9BURK|nr:aminoacyl-tRNA hydrolase [Inhella inkyongensis]MBB5204614.1 PTH1 family peptidyl-tRNA hydrolase [Inhella inkyongensis]
MLRMLVGLGNPGTEYEDTRHNAGFAWVDAVARELKVSLQAERSYFGLAARARTAQGDVWLLEPMTYMNLSGKSVAALARFFKIQPQEILVAHDELDLPPGEMKLKRGGSAAGHNGLKDMAAQLGSQDFWRLRLGIGHPGQRDAVAGYVLRRAPAAERDLLQDCIHKSLPALPLLLAGEFDRATQALHAKPQRPKPARKPAAEGPEASA